MSNSSEPISHEEPEIEQPESKDYRRRLLEDFETVEDLARRLPLDGIPYERVPSGVRRWASLFLGDDLRGSLNQQRREGKDTVRVLCFPRDGDSGSISFTNHVVLPEIVEDPREHLEGIGPLKYELRVERVTADVESALYMREQPGLEEKGTTWYFVDENGLLKKMLAVPAPVPVTSKEFHWEVVPESKYIFPETTGADYETVGYKLSRINNMLSLPDLTARPIQKPRVA